MATELEELVRSYIVNSRKSAFLFRVAPPLGVLARMLEREELRLYLTPC